MLKQKETSKRLLILHFRIILILQQTKKLVGWQHFVHDREKKEEEKKKKKIWKGPNSRHWPEDHSLWRRECAVNISHCQIFTLLQQNYVAQQKTHQVLSDSLRCTWAGYVTCHFSSLQDKRLLWFLGLMAKWTRWPACCKLAIALDLIFSILFCNSTWCVSTIYGKKKKLAIFSKSDKPLIALSMQ